MASDRFLATYVLPSFNALHHPLSLPLSSDRWAEQPTIANQPQPCINLSKHSDRNCRPAFIRCTHKQSRTTESARKGEDNGGGRKRMGWDSFG